MSKLSNSEVKYNLHEALTIPFLTLTETVIKPDHSKREQIAHEAAKEYFGKRSLMEILEGIRSILSLTVMKPTNFIKLNETLTIVQGSVYDILSIHGDTFNKTHQPSYENLVCYFSLDVLREIDCFWHNAQHDQTDIGVYINYVSPELADMKAMCLKYFLLWEECFDKKN